LDQDRMGLTASAASHRVRFVRPGEASVESEYELWAENDVVVNWAIPVGEARDLTAMLDDRPAPILIEPGGQLATVAIAGRGRHRLQVRRAVGRRGDEAIRVPVNAVASARISVVTATGLRSWEVVSARGRIEPTPGGLAGSLGPADRIELALR